MRTIRMNFQDLSKDLSRFGFGLREDVMPLEEGRVMEIYDFLLGKIIPQKTINKKVSSYGLKHTVERAFGSYVANGELIAAMYLLGFKVEIYGINVHFDVSSRSIDLNIRGYAINQTKKMEIETLTKKQFLRGDKFFLTGYTRPFHLSQSGGVKEISAFLGIGKIKFLRIQAGIVYCDGVVQEIRIPLSKMKKEVALLME